MQVYNDEELYHYGKLGMKWGHRNAHASMPHMITTKRQLEADKNVLNKMNNGSHVGIGFTKKRQAAYDKRNKAIFEARIAKNTNKINTKEEHKQIIKNNVKAYNKAYDKVSNMSDKADKQWEVLNEAYKKTGKNRISRVINNIKY